MHLSLQIHRGGAAAVATILVGCVSRASLERSLPLMPRLSLVAPHGGSVDAMEVAQRARLTVFIFFSLHCHCLDVHEPRLFALDAAYQPRGVQFLMIDSEVGGSVERDEREANARKYPFPILLDPGAKLANALGARYATYSVVLDTGGRVRYRGNIDSDKTHLHENAIPHLKNAIDDLLAGRAPRASSGEGLGCALQTW